MGSRIVFHLVFIQFFGYELDYLSYLGQNHAHFFSAGASSCAPKASLKPSAQDEFGYAPIGTWR